jgi:hypothetical protein
MECEYLGTTGRDAVRRQELTVHARNSVHIV